jgi:hypothetical protein
MDQVIADINRLCARDVYLRFSDEKVRCSRFFYHLLVMDGQEVGAALMCDVNQCPVCNFPHDELDRADVSYRDTETVKAAVKAAQEQHLDDDGEMLACHHAEVRAISIILSHMVCDIIPYIGYFFLEMA